jgi:membrane associated rhomboid family serine protease
MKLDLPTPTDVPSSLAAPGNSHSVGDEVRGVLVFVAAIWGVFALDFALPLSEWFALIPRDIGRLPGIVAIHFLHAGWGHLLANTVPLIVLLTLLAGSRANSWPAC